MAMQQRLFLAVGESRATPLYPMPTYTISEMLNRQQTMPGHFIQVWAVDDQLV